MSKPKKPVQKRLTERGRVQVNFELEPELHEKLRQLAINEDRNISQVLRRLIKAAAIQAGL